MWLTLLNNWRVVLGGAIVAVVTASFALMIHNIDARITKTYYENQLAEQQVKLTDQCNADKALTQEVSNVYQSRLSDLSGQLALARKLRNPRCVVPSSSPTGGHNAAAPVGQPIGGDAGLSTDALIDYAGRAERYRLQLLGCQDFVSRAFSPKE